MKRIITLSVIALLTALASMAAAPKSAFSDLKSVDGVTRVYISKAMMQLSDSFTDGMPADLGEGTKLDDLEVYTCSTPQTITMAREALQKELKNTPDIEELLMVTEDDDETMIYGVPFKGGSTIVYKNGTKVSAFSHIIIFTRDDKEVTVLLLNGYITFD